MRSRDQSAQRGLQPGCQENLGSNVADALLGRQVVALPPEPFVGAGVYALYYTGCFEPYHQIAQANRDDRHAMPVYIGKAVPPGARKGGFGLDANPGSALFKRLNDHATSIKQADNLDLGDFWCRYLVVDDIWILLGESLLINRFLPIWNTLIDGFGNHDPGGGRSNQARSRWDVLHPGRPWAERLRENDDNADESSGSYRNLSRPRAVEFTTICQVLDVPLRPLVGVRGRRRTDRGRRGRTGRPGWRRRGIGRRTWRRPGRRRRRDGIENACSILHGSQNLARLFSSTVLKNAIASRRLATTPYRPGQALTGLLPPCRLSGADGSGGRGVGRWAAQCARAPVRRPSRAAGFRCHHSPRRQP